MSVIKTVLAVQRHYHKKRRGPLATSAQTLTLISAVYSINDALVTLVFNREINLDDLDVSAFVINDGLYTNEKLQGDSFTADGTTSVQISFTQVEAYSGSTTTLDASALNGIKAADDAATWAGVTGYVLEIG